MLWFLSLLAVSAGQLLCPSTPTDFLTDSAEKWLYDNLAPNGDCFSFKLSEGDPCFEFIASTDYSLWPQTKFAFIPGNNNLTVFVKDLNPNDAYKICIDQCRFIDWCRSIDYDSGYERCYLSSVYGEDKLQKLDPNSGYVDYYEKPVCQQNSASKPGSLSLFRLGVKLLQSGYLPLANDKFNQSIVRNKWYPMAYWGKCLTSLLMVLQSGAQTASDASQILDALGSQTNLMTVSANEQKYITALNMTLQRPRSDWAITLATQYEAIFNASAGYDGLAGSIAAQSYFLAGGVNIDRSRYLLKTVLLKSPNSSLALSLYLSEFAQQRNDVSQASPSEKAILLDYSTRIIALNPGNPLVYAQTQMLHYWLGNFNESLRIGTAGITKVQAATERGLAPDQLLSLYIQMNDILHAAYLMCANMSGASALRSRLRDEANGSLTNQATQQALTALYAKCLAKAYFTFSFTGDDFAALPPQANIFPSGDNFEYKIADILLRLAMVVKMAGTSTTPSLAVFTQYTTLLNLIDATRSQTNSTSFQTVLQVNKYLLQAYFNLPSSSNPRAEILGDYMDKAISLYEGLTDYEQSLVAINPLQALVYAVKRISQRQAGTLRSSSSSKIPSSLANLQTELQRISPKPPGVWMGLSWIQFALENDSQALSTLDQLASQLIPATFPWIEAARSEIRQQSYSLADLGFSPIEKNPALRFSPEAYNIYTKLEVGWMWSIDASAMPECLAIQYTNINSTSAWNRIDQASVNSSNTKTYSAGNLYMCKQRCLFETRFSCKAVTYGYGRCIVHDSASPVINGLLDETLYVVPACITPETNAWSQLQLAMKAFQNDFIELAIASANKAVALDPLMGAANVLLDLFRTHVAKLDCGYLGSLGFPNQVYQLTDQEALYRTGVNYLSEGKLDRALNTFTDIATKYTMDTFAKEVQIDLKLETKQWQDGQYIAEILRRSALATASSYDLENKFFIQFDNGSYDDALKTTDLIASRSPGASAAYELRALISYKNEDWLGMLGNASAALNLLLTAEYNNSVKATSQLAAMSQIKHYALLEAGKIKEATSVYETISSLANSRNTPQLYEVVYEMYSRQVYYLTIVEPTKLTAFADPNFDASSSCADFVLSKGVAQFMSAVKTLSISDNSSDWDSAKNTVESTVTNQRTGINSTIIDAWDNVMEAFYAKRISDMSYARREVGEILAQANVAPATYALGTEELLAPGFGIIIPEEIQLFVELQAVSSLKTGSEKSKKYQDLENILLGFENLYRDEVVAGWLKFRLYKQAWLDTKESQYANKSMAARDAILVLLKDGDTEYPSYVEAKQYDSSLGPTTGELVLNQSLPEWLIILIIILCVIVFVAIILGIVLHMACQQKQKSHTPYTGSIYSTSERSNRSIIAEPDSIRMYKGDMAEKGEINGDFHN